MDVCLSLCFVLGLTTTFVSVSGGYEYDPDYLIPPNCKPCDAKSCPQLTFCAGKVVKDHCGCCPRCSSDRFQPHPVFPRPQKNEINETNTVPTEVDPCQLRQCPKFKICMINIQGLPVCTCPSPQVCEKRRGKRANKLMEEICGSDGVMYKSKCHLRLANCNSLKRIKRVHNKMCVKKLDAGNNFGNAFGNGIGQTGTGNMLEKPLSHKEEKARMKALKRARRKKLKRRKRKNRKLRKQQKKERKEREKNRRRSKRRNNVFTPYSSHYDFLLRKHTNWGHTQVRKSRI